MTEEVTVDPAHNAPPESKEVPKAADAPPPAESHQPAPESHPEAAHEAAPAGHETAAAAAPDAAQVRRVLSFPEDLSNGLNPAQYQAWLELRRGLKRGGPLDAAAFLALPEDMSNSGMNPTQYADWIAFRAELKK